MSEQELPGQIDFFPDLWMVQNKGVSDFQGTKRASEVCFTWNMHINRSFELSELVPYMARARKTQRSYKEPQTCLLNIGARKLLSLIILHWARVS